jgi:hypothetical protein
VKNIQKVSEIKPLPPYWECLGKTPGYPRYSGYSTPEDEAKFLPILGPIWRFGDPLPAKRRRV